MIQNYLDNIQENNKVITGLIVFAITFFLSLSIFNFLNSNFSNDVGNEYCKNFVNPVIKYQDEIEIINNDIYIFPEIKNLLCINKVTNLEVNNNVKFLTIGTNPKIVNLIISITFICLYIFSFRKKISTVFAVYLFFIFGLSYNFFFSINFYSINIVLFFTFLIINNFSINNDESIEFRKENTKNFNLINLFLFIFYFLFIALTQFSTHNIETMDWDINSFIVTSMDFKNGHLPFEIHYENKPPLLFLNYFIITEFANGSLLNIKILNDVLILLIVLILHFTILKRSKNLYLSLICSLIFIILISKDWFHPGYSELHSLFYLALSIYFFEGNAKSGNKMVSAVFLSFATLCNLGTVIFIIPFLVRLFLNQKKINRLFYFIINFSIPHIIFMIIYVIRGSFSNYIVAMLEIPRNYPRLGSNSVSELGVFLKGINDFSVFINVLIVLILSKIFSQIFMHNNWKIIIRDINFQLLLFSFGFYFLASIGYQHHLLFIIFFLSFSAMYFIKKIDAYILIPLIFLSVFNIGLNQFKDSFENISYYSELEEQYPLSKASNIYFKNISNEDSFLALDNYLILYYLDKGNASYISHPALYEEQFVLQPLSKLGLANLNEIESATQKLPEFIICSNLISYCDNFDIYELVETNEVNNLNFHYYQKEKKLKIFKLNY